MEALGSPFEKLELFLLGRKRTSDRVPELGAIKADAVRLVEHRRFGVRQLACVGEKPDRRPVRGDRRQVDQLAQLVLVGPDVGLEPLVFALDRAGRVDEHDAGDPVDNQPVAGLDAARPR